MSLDGQAQMMRRIIEIRHVVGFLGEKSQCNWWPTSFYETSSIRFLEPVFSRTAVLARYTGAVEAARRFHDENLSVGSYHIFRLPEEIEQDLHEMVQAKSGELFDPSVVIDQSAALSALSKFSEEPVEAPVGPVMVGTIDALRTTNLLQKIRSIYQSALLSNKQALPYLIP